MAKKCRDCGKHQNCYTDCQQKCTCPPLESFALLARRALTGRYLRRRA